MSSEDVRFICFYLPQYYPIPENDLAWGKGYTDWRRVVQAQPLFEGHYQPRIPADLGLYDLRLQESQIAQAEIASQYGITGFCYYMYWMGEGKKLLERPMEQMFASGKPDYPFCVCWANHHWRLNWIGQADAIVKQHYSEEDAVLMMEHMIPMFKDDRYIKVDGKPLFIVYGSQVLPDPPRYAEIFRKAAKDAGFKDIFLCRIEKDNQILDPTTIGFDAAIEFPPSGLRSVTVSVKPSDPTNGFSGNVNDYEQTAFYALNRPSPDFKFLRGVMPQWDNTARRPPNDATIFQGATPEAYEQWLRECVEWTKANRQGEERLIFCNAWNEWGESAYLEPDLRYGHAYLEATRRALSGASNDSQHLSISRIGYQYDRADLCDQAGQKLSPSDKIVGSVDRIWKQDERICIAGWGCDLESPDRQVNILLFEDGVLKTADRTFIARPDVAKSINEKAVKAGFHLEIQSNLVKAKDLAALKVVVVSEKRRYAALAVPKAMVSL
ncbi:MAG: glycoside hydrolase family 99-like domain-containing protein [Candidatus Melainabacteria bacterium]|nr:glycoside hydrolase family 99-like domain-containing protein [Candidatus Melainabacteria bacterium]